MEMKTPTATQKNLVQMMANDMRQSEIAKELFVSVRTLQTMLREIRQIWGLKHRESLCVHFYKNGWIE